MNILKKNRVIFVTPRENKDVKGGIASWTTKLENQRLPEGEALKMKCFPEKSIENQRLL